MQEGTQQALLLADTVMVNCGLAVLVGSFASLIWLLGAESDWAVEVRRTSYAGLKAGAAVAFVASSLGLWLQAFIMADTPLWGAGPTALVLIRETHLGHAWLAGIAALVLVAPMIPKRKLSTRGPVRLATTAVAIAGFAYTRSIGSHAGGQGDLSLSVMVDWLHLMLVSLWAGTVFTGAFGVLPRPVPLSMDRTDAAGWVASLSRVATSALVAIVLTGIFSIWRGAASGHEVLGSTWGNALVVKLSLVAVAIGLGGFNRFRVMPGLMHDLRHASNPTSDAKNLFVRILRVEALVLVTVLVAAAFLSNSS